MHPLDIDMHELTYNNLYSAQRALRLIFPNDGRVPSTVFTKSLACEETKRKYFGTATNDTLQYWVLKCNTRVVGTTGLYSVETDSHSLGLGWYGIIPDYRRKGLGQSLLTWTMSKAKELGASRLELWTTSDESCRSALQLYYKYGFVLDKIEMYRKKPILWLSAKLK